MKPYAVLFLVLTVFPSVLRSQTREISFTGGGIGAHHMGYGDPIPYAAVAGQLSPGPFDFGGGLSYSSNPKIGTPGGYQRDLWGFGRVWFGDRFFVSGELTRAHADATVWTKNVTSAGVSGGVQLTAPGTVHNRMVIAISHDREIATDAVSPNRSRSWTAFWQNDFHLKGPAHLRVDMSYSYVRFLQGGDWWTGHVSRIGVGIAFRARS